MKERDWFGEPPKWALRIKNDKITDICWHCWNGLGVFGKIKSFVREIIPIILGRS